MMAFTALVLCVMSAAPQQDYSGLEQAVRQASRVQHFVRSSQGELQRAEELFRRSFQEPMAMDELKVAWAELDMELISWDRDDGTEGRQLWVLREKVGFERGRGFYTLRHGDALPIMIQAPHGFGDTYTRSIGCSLFLERPFVGAGWNTVHRDHADLAHLSDTYFNAFTRAFVDTHQECLVVQIHGFSKKKRSTAQGALADVIVSNGSKYSNENLRGSVEFLKQLYPQFSVRLFPDDVYELGGTTNAQGKEIRSLGSTGFVHFEMSKEFRKDMIREPKQLRMLSEFVIHCFQNQFEKASFSSGR